MIITEGNFKNIQMLRSHLRPIKSKFLEVGFRHLSFLSPPGYPRVDQMQWEQWYYGFLLVINVAVSMVDIDVSQKGLPPHLVTSKNGYTRCRISASLHQIIVSTRSLPWIPVFPGNNLISSCILGLNGPFINFATI